MSLDILSNVIIKRVTVATNSYSDMYASAVRQNRPRWGIIIKYEGETVYTSGSKKIISNINNVIVLPKGCNYEWECVKAGGFATIEFECDTECREIFSFNVKNGEKILNMFKEMEYKRTLKKPMFETECIRDCYSIILKLAEENNKAYLSSDKQQKILPAVEYIARNYTKNIKNDELAELTGLSTVYFRKLFTNVYGVSPISYIRNLKIKKAKEMLRGDYGSITDIAYSLGYSNIYEFSRDFKKQTGVAPSKYQL